MRFEDKSHSFFIDLIVRFLGRLPIKKLGSYDPKGYFAVGDEFTSGLVDQKEGIYFGREGDPLGPRPLHGANLWPSQPEILAAAVAGWSKGSMNSSSLGCAR